MFGKGLIPACAGKTSHASMSASQASAHPRVCGENILQSCVARPRAGSSPRVRGKLTVLGKLPIHMRLIPACAGKTSKPRLIIASLKAHPRVCGENPPPARHRRRRWGSSPRVRGKLEKLYIRCTLRGLIPACAGKTTLLAYGTAHAWAHPRVCGENFVSLVAFSVSVGSSPRVRGKLARLAARHDARRLIPACAGKTV